METGTMSSTQLWMQQYKYFNKLCFCVQWCTKIIYLSNFQNAFVWQNAFTRNLSIIHKEQAYHIQAMQYVVNKNKRDISNMLRLLRRLQYTIKTVCRIKTFLNNFVGVQYEYIYKIINIRVKFACTKLCTGLFTPKWI